MHAMATIPSATVECRTQVRCHALPLNTSIRCHTSRMTHHVGAHSLPKQVDPAAPFSYFFMDDQYNNVYSKEVKIIKTLTLSTIISLFLLLLGIISVSYLVSTSKVNEMAIRRILGADTKSILRIFLNEYITPFIIALCLAIPLVYLLLNEWLTKYMNRTKIGFDVFIYALVVIAGTFLIISVIMTYKIIHDNPVKNLRED